jgi:alanine dehydrogenase
VSSVLWRARIALLLTDQDVDSLFSMEEAIPVVEDALRQQASGSAANCPRGHDIAGRGVYLAHMRAALYAQNVFGFKTYTVASGSVRFLVYLYDAGTGALLSILEASRLGQLRTGAATGVSVKHIAREDASAVGILGSGYQAGTQLEAVCKARSIFSASVYSPNPEHRRAFAERTSQQLGIEIKAADSPAEVVKGADILVTITASQTPVFDGDWLRPGTHIAAAGGANEYVRELDDATIQRVDILVVDDKAQARIECGELKMPASRGLILWEQVRELWQVVGGVIPGRRGPQDITLFKSLGMALWDVAAAKAVYDKAVTQGVGVSIGE